MSTVCLLDSCWEILYKASWVKSHFWSWKKKQTNICIYFCIQKKKCTAMAVEIWLSLSTPDSSAPWTEDGNDVTPCVQWRSSAVCNSSLTHSDSFGPRNEFILTERTSWFMTNKKNDHWLCSFTGIVWNFEKHLVAESLLQSMYVKWDYNNETAQFKIRKQQSNDFKNTFTRASNANGNIRSTERQIKKKYLWIFKTNILLVIV